MFGLQEATLEIMESDHFSLGKWAKLRPRTC